MRERDHQRPFKKRSELLQGLSLISQVYNQGRQQKDEPRRSSTRGLPQEHQYDQPATKSPLHLIGSDCHLHHQGQHNQPHKAL